MNNHFILITAASLLGFSTAALSNDDATYAKDVCTSLGFKSGSEKHANCSLKVFQRFTKDKEQGVRKADEEQARRREELQEQTQREATAYQRQVLEAERRRLTDLQRQQLLIQKQQLEEAKRARRAKAWDSFGQALTGFSNQPAAQPSIAKPTIRPPINCYSSNNGYNVTTQCQ